MPLRNTGALWRRPQKKAFDKLEAQMVGSKAINLAADEEKAIRTYLVMQTKRNPLFFDKIDTSKINQDCARDVLADYEFDSKKSISQEAILNFLEKKNLERIFVNAKIHSMNMDDPEFTQVLDKKYILFAFIRQPDKSFVIGNFPFVALNSDGLLNPTSELWNIVSPKLAVTFHSSTVPSRVCFLSTEEIRRLNKQTFQASTEVVSSSEQLLKSLAFMWQPRM